MSMSEKRLILRVEYLDHVSVEGETKFKDVEEARPLKCVVFGELIREDDLSITILSYREEPADLAATEHFAMVILKSCIVQRTELEEKSHV